MVVNELSRDEVDRLFRALADATRRDIVTRVLRRDHSVTALAGHYDMTFAAVQKHVAVLERADLVSKQRHGREQIVHGNVATLQRASALLESFERLWIERGTQIAEMLGEKGSTP